MWKFCVSLFLIGNVLILRSYTRQTFAFAFCGSYSVTYFSIPFLRKLFVFVIFPFSTVLLSCLSHFHFTLRQQRKSQTFHQLSPPWDMPFCWRAFPLISAAFFTRTIMCELRRRSISSNTRSAQKKKSNLMHFFVQKLHGRGSVHRFHPNTCLICV